MREQRSTSKEEEVEVWRRRWRWRRGWTSQMRRTTRHGGLRRRARDPARWLCLCALPAVRNVLCPQRALSATCSAAEKESQQRALCGRRVLAAHILDGATGWYIGTVQNFGVGAAWKQPDATHIVRYQKKETGTKHLEGRVACNLDADNYGQSEWWLLLEPKPK